MCPEKTVRAAGRSKSSRQWLRDHQQDFWVRSAQQQGYRSRASFKLIEIQEKDRLLRAGMQVVDLGAAPGGWSQVAGALVGRQGRVFAFDRLPVDPLENVVVLQEDFETDAGVEQLLALLVGRKIDLVMSDMAPNITGIIDADQARSLYLAELALDLALKVLKEDGDFLVKVFQGEGLDAYRDVLQAAFSSLKVRKPKASRPKSRELYLLARGLKKRDAVLQSEIGSR